MNTSSRHKAALQLAAAALLTVALVALADRGKRTLQQTPSHPDVQVFTDVQTGCQYFKGEGGLTPRLRHDGLPLCPDIPQEELVHER